MYSVILMAAMTANTAEAPAFHGQRACGCYGGLFLHGGGYGSCMGCWGSGYGCCGGGYGGCYGSCYGGYGGCWGSGYGCYGAYGAYSGGCYGCMGCYGGWAGYGEYATPGAVAYPGMNPMTAPPGTTNPPKSETGTGTGTPPAGTGTPPAGTGTPPAGTTPPPPGTSGRPTGTSARLVIEKPADAQLYVDERPVKSDGAVETFATPNLDPSQAYYYMVRVEAVRDGKPVSETRRVIVRAGDTIRETFTAPGVATASLKLPAGR